MIEDSRRSRVAPTPGQPSEVTRRSFLAASASATLALGLRPGEAPAAGPEPLDAGAAGSRFDQMLEAYWSDYLHLNPSLALSVGDYSTQALFDESLEDEWRTRMRDLLHRYSTALASFKPEALSPEQRISHSMLAYRLEMDLRFHGSPLSETARMLPIVQFLGPHIAYAVAAAGSGAYPFKTVEDYDKALLRADAYARWTGEAIERLREGVAHQVVLPRLVVERILPQLQAHLGVPPEQTQFWHPLQKLPEAASPADRKRLTAAYRTKIAEVIQPAYQRLHDYLKTQYLPHARESVGLSALPGGKALYAWYVRHHTTTDLSPREIHALGISEVRRIEAQLEAVKHDVGFTGTLREFLSHVREDPAQHFQQAEEVIPAFDAARREILPHLPQLFDVLPKAPYEVRALPESSRQSQDNGYYSPAAADGSRPGILWMNIHAAGVRDRFNVMTISLHEGLPGHHLQTSLAQERPDLPSFRRFDTTNAYLEGWGLYAESLGELMGLFSDPWQHFGHLNYAILRANRLVIDTGLHAQGWSVDRGVQWMVEHSSMTAEEARAEVERYVSAPGQALSYKLGELTLLDLREKAQKALGARFDIKAFHDQILLGGPLPLTILRQKVGRWIGSGAGARPA